MGAGGEPLSPGRPAGDIVPGGARDRLSRLRQIAAEVAGHEATCSGLARRRGEGLAAFVRGLPRGPDRHGQEILGPDAPVTDGDLVALVDVEARDPATGEVAATLGRMLDGSLVTADGTVIPDAVATHQPEGMRLAIRYGRGDVDPPLLAMGPTVRLAGRVGVAAGPDEAAGAAAAEVAALAGEARRIAGEGVDAQSAAERNVALVMALGAVPLSGEGMDSALARATPAIHAAPATDAIHLSLQMTGRNWTRMLPILKAHPRLDGEPEATPRTETTVLGPLRWRAPDGGEGPSRTAAVPEGSIQVVADPRSREAILGFAARPQAGDGLPTVGWASRSAPTFHGRVATVEDGMALLEAAVASPAKAAVADQLAAAGFARAPNAGAPPGEARWTRRTPKGRLTAVVDEASVNLTYERHRWAKPDLLLDVAMRRAPGRGTRLPGAWPAAMDAIEALVGMACAMALRHQSDGRDEAPRRPARARGTGGTKADPGGSPDATGDGG